MKNQKKNTTSKQKVLSRVDLKGVRLCQFYTDNPDLFHNDKRKQYNILGGVDFLPLYDDVEEDV